MDEFYKYLDVEGNHIHLYKALVGLEKNYNHVKSKLRLKGKDKADTQKKLKKSQRSLQKHQDAINTWEAENQKLLSEYTELEDQMARTAQENTSLKEEIAELKDQLSQHGGGFKVDGPPIGLGSEKGHNLPPPRLPQPQLP